MKKVIIIAVISIFTCLQSVYPQITTNELPVSVQKGIAAITKGRMTGTVYLPVPDIKKILHEDSLCQKKHPNGLQRTSVPIPLELNLSKDGIWTTLEDGDRLWQMEVHAEKALALDFVFSKFWLPKGGKFFIFNPSTNETIGAVTSKYLLGERAKPQRFSTGIVKGDNIILEYYQPAEEKELPVIEVEKAYYTYIPAPNFLSESTCSYEVNVNCSEGNNWQLEKNAVALVYRKFVQGGGWCSGSLVNNTQNNLSPLFLTANHCLEGDFTGFNGYVEQKDAIYDNDLSDWIFYWGYELENCSSTTQPDYYNKTTNGAIVKANNSYSDFALLQLQQDPLNLLPNYVPYYLGWDVSGSSGTGGVCIHHPNHDVKKISTYSCTPQAMSVDSSPSVYWGVQWAPTDNGHGITEGGSSGSPLINNDHRIIGQLYGGFSDCSNLTETDKYGMISVSWTGNDNNDNRRRLDYWLDSIGTNSQVINGIDPLGQLRISGSAVVCDTAEYYVEYLPGACWVTWSIDNPDFTIVSSGNLCKVVYTWQNQAYSTANLKAFIFYENNFLKVLSKRIVMHGTTLNVTGWQYGGLITPNGIMPDRTFTIPANKGSITVPDKTSMDELFGEESLPIDFTEDNSLDRSHDPVDLCGYGITEINGGNEVYLSSTRFNGMDISFSGLYSPTSFNHSGNNVTFEMPYSSSEYPVVMQVHSDAQCHDFCLTFNVVPLPGAAAGSEMIWVNLDGSMLYVTVMADFPSFSATITKIPGGTQVYSNTIYRPQNSFSVDTSTWTSGIYSIRIVANGQTYTKIIYIE